MKKRESILFRTLVALLFISFHQLNGQAPIYKEEIDIPGESTWQSAHITTYDGGSMVLTCTGNITNQTYLTFIKTSASGTIQWNKRFGPVVPSFKNVVQSPDSGYFVCYVDAGNFNQKYHVLKLDKYGTVVFSNEMSHPGNFGITGLPDVIAKNNGGFYVICDLLDTITYNFLWHVFEIDNAGNLLWSHCYNIRSAKSYHADADTCQNGDLVILGTLYDDLTQLHYPIITRITSGGLPVWTKYYSDGVRHFLSSSIVRMAGDHLLVTATCSHPVSFQSEIALMKTDGQGNELWTFLLWSASSNSNLTTIEAVENNCTLIVGNNGMDGLAIKTDSTGLMLSSRTYPGTIFCSMDTMPGSLYSFAGYNASSTRTVLMTTDQSGVGCADNPVTLIKTPIAMQDTLSGSDTILPLTSLPVALPQAFPTIHIEEICNTIGINEHFAVTDVRVYPVPASQYICIKSESAITACVLVAADGSIVKRAVVNSSVYTMDISAISDGVYFLRIITPSETQVRKIIVQH